MKLTKGYTILVGLISISLATSGFAAFQFSEVKPEKKSNHLTAVDKVNITERTKSKTKKFKKNDKLDKLKPKKEEGLSPALVGESLSDSKIPDKLKDGKYRGSARGYGGIITVEVTISNGKILSIDVISHSETPGYYENGARVLDRIVNSQSVDVDSVSGATITSRALKVAVARALEKAGLEESSNEPEVIETVAEVPPEMEDDVNDGDLGQLKDGKYQGSAKGYAGNITVEVEVKDGKIKNIKVVSHRETQGYYQSGARVISKILKAQNLNVDTVSGATYTSRAIKVAVARALAKAGAGNVDELANSKDPIVITSGGRTDDPLGDGGVKTIELSAISDTMLSAMNDKDSVKVANLLKEDHSLYALENRDYKGKVNIKIKPNKVVDKIVKIKKDGSLEELKAISVDGVLIVDNLVDGNLLVTYKSQNSSESKLKDGKYIGDGVGYNKYGKIRVEVTIKNGVIEKARVVSTDDDYEYFRMAKDILKKVVSKKNLDNVDSVSGATYSSVGIKLALADALSKAVQSTDETRPEEQPGKEEEGSNKVEEPVVLTNMTIVSSPKLTYFKGEQLDLSGLKINLFYSDGEEETVSFGDFSNKGIKVSMANGSTLDSVGAQTVLVSKEGKELRLTVTTKEKPVKPLELGYVEKIAGNYSSFIFQRPAEVGAKLYDGVYYGHGRGYYVETGDPKSTLSYTRNTIVKVVVKDGKVAEVHSEAFGDDTDGGNTGYKAKAETFKGSVFNLVKNSSDNFIKLHMDIERYLAKHQTSNVQGLTLFPNDNDNIIELKLKPRIRKADAITGATMSSGGYSRAIAQALYKASKNEKQINDIRLNDYDLVYKIETGNSMEKNQYYGMSTEKKRAFRSEKGYFKVDYYAGEHFDPTNLKLIVSYTDGTKEEIPFDKLEEKGFKATLTDTGTGEVIVPTANYVFPQTYYAQMLKIEKVDGDPNILNNFVNSKIIVSERK